MLDTLTSYRLITKDLTKSLNRTASDPIVARELKYFKENIGKIKSIDDFIKNTRIFNFAMKAHGLEDMSYAKAFMRKALTEGIDDPKSFANRLNDDRYKDFVQAFNFKEFGEETTARDAVKKETVDKYLRQTLEANAGAEDQGVRLALYFERKASSIKGPFDILGDTALFEVVKTAFNLQGSLASGNIDAQAALLKKKINFESLKDPVAVQGIVKKFATMWDITNNSQSNPILTLFDSTSSRGIGIDALLSLQQIRSRG